jgi:hypothetical protein
MPLPPFANLFAVHDADPARLDAILRDLQRSAEFAEVWRPAPGWVAAVAPLPEEALPEDLAGAVGEEWLAQPPQEVEYWPLRSLTRLGLFGAALRARRQEREGRPGQLQVVQ